MASWYYNFFANILLRLTGLLLLGVAIFGLNRLSQHVQWHAAAQTTPVEMLGFVAVLIGLSAGAALLVLGAQIYERIQISDRWLA